MQRFQKLSYMKGLPAHEWEDQKGRSVMGDVFYPFRFARYAAVALNVIVVMMKSIVKFL